MVPRNGVWKTRSAPSARITRCCGCSSWMASCTISESIAMVPEWLETTSAPPVAGMFSMPRTSTRNQCR